MISNGSGSRPKWILTIRIYPSNQGFALTTIFGSIEMKKFQNLLSTTQRALPYIWSPYNFANLLIISCYSGYRSVYPGGYSTNIVVTTVLMIFARALRSSNSRGMIQLGEFNVCF